MSSSQEEHSPPPHLLEPYHYISSTPGKNIRSALIDCFQLWLCVPPGPAGDTNSNQNTDTLSEIKSIIAALHNASLIIDDIEDNSKLRRGNPVAHSIFGIANCINCANYVYFLAMEQCRRLGREEALQIFITEMLNLHRGQGHDIHTRDSTSCPTESQYISMVIDKTGGLFRLAVKLMQLFATSNRDVNYIPLVNNLGLWFQIRDDLINLADEEYFKSKSFCEDLTEGKFSFPIIHCIRGGENDDESDGKQIDGKLSDGGEKNNNQYDGGFKPSSSSGNQLLSILKQRTEDVDVKRYAQRLMFEAGSLHYTREKCTQLKNEIVQQIEDLGGNKPLLKVIEMLDVQVEKIAELHGREFGGDCGDGKGDESKSLDYT